jgi:DNA polymerase-3 subunit delta
MSVILIHGENEFKASEFYDQVLRGFKDKNSLQSLHVFDGENATIIDIQEALSAQSLFSSGSEMVAIRRLGKNTELRDELTKLIPGITEEMQLVIYEPRIDKRSKLYKLLKKNNQTKEFFDLSEGELFDWINGLIKQRGGSLEAGGAKQLVSRTRGNQLRLSGEINKLLNYDKSITLDSIELLVERIPDDNIFDLLNYVVQGSKQKAIAKYEELREAQVEAHYVLVMLCWQMANFLSIKVSHGKSDKEIASQLGMNPYAVGKTLQTVRSLTLNQLSDMTRKILDVDTKLKTTSLDVNQLVKKLLIEL